MPYPRNEAAKHVHAPNGCTPPVRSFEGLSALAASLERYWDTMSFHTYSKSTARTFHRKQAVEKSITNGGLVHPKLLCRTTSYILFRLGTKTTSGQSLLRPFCHPHAHTPLPSCHDHNP